MKRTFLAIFCGLLFATTASAQYSRTVMADENWYLAQRDAIIQTNGLAVRFGDITGDTNTTTVTGIHGSALPAPGGGDVGKAYEWTGAAWILTAGGGASTSSWGMIIGTITNQVDLWTELTNRYTRAEVDGLPVSTFTNDSGYLITQFTNYVAVSGGLLGLVGGNRSGSNTWTLTEADLAGAGFLTNNQQNVTLEGIFTRDGTNYVLLGSSGGWTNLSEYNNDSGFITGIAWGDVTGTLSAQTDLNTELTNRYTKAQAASQFVEDSEKAVANGVATLDAGAKVPFGQIPAIAITDVYVVDTTNELAAITNVLMGDVAIVLDTPNLGTNANSYIATNEVLPSAIDSWVIIEKPLQYVSSVNGKMGVVVLNTDDILTGSSNLWYTIARTSSDGFITNNQSGVTFGALDVTVDATAGTDAVNWQSLTNYTPALPPATNSTTRVFIDGPSEIFRLSSSGVVISPSEVTNFYADGSDVWIGDASGISAFDADTRTIIAADGNAIFDGANYLINYSTGTRRIDLGNGYLMDGVANTNLDWLTSTLLDDGDVALNWDTRTLDNAGLAGGTWYAPGDSSTAGGNSIVNWTSMTNYVAGVLPVVSNNYPVILLELGGQWTDFELKASTNNFESLVYYLNSSTTNVSADDTNAWVYFTDDYGEDARQWHRATNGMAIVDQVANTTSSVVERVMVCPSHQTQIEWSDWMWKTNNNLVWSYIRYDGISLEMNASGTKGRWNLIYPTMWREERVDID